MSRRKEKGLANPGRRAFLKKTAGAALAAAASGLTGLSCGGRSSQPIKVGIMHSLSGTMAISETSLRDVELMAIEEINAAGGVLGRQVQAIVEDPASDWPTFAEKSRKLLLSDQVCSVFGCWTSASRKAVLPVFEKNNGLLWYPVQYEGNECSHNVFYTGAAPNQQIGPAVTWLLKNRGKKFYLLGSDYVFPRTANGIIKGQLAQEGGQLVGEEYTPLGHMEYSTVVNKIRAAKPDVVFSTINGDSNVAFYKQLRNAGITADDIPVMAVSVAEDEVRGIGGSVAAGHYASWNYYQSVDTPENKAFVAKFKAKYGDNRVTDDPIEAAYFQVHLWAQAVQKANSIEVDAIRAAALGQEFKAPEGLVRIDPKNQHTWKTVRIGKIREDGQFDIVWSTDGPIRPEPWDKIQFPKRDCDWTRGGTVENAS
ncbi:MAG TPA: urea ABC transporter substrate-binding protein [Bryobacterales bacterium]|jgi:urea transport system substrate-binding protein|nr:urea ABC transporter substrate-binding protein [Bryobacterales bacterium]